MQKSAHNIFSHVADSDSWFIVNPLSGQADILDLETAEEYRTGIFSDPGAWEEKGYLVEPEDEKKRFMNGYLEWVDRRDSDEIQIFFVPSYACPPRGSDPITCFSSRINLASCCPADSINNQYIFAQKYWTLNHPHFP